MSEVRPLIAQVVPFEGESLASVLARAANLNGFQKISELYAFTRESRAKPEFGAFSRDGGVPEDIARLLGLDKNVAIGLFHPVVTRPGLGDAVRFNGTLLPRRFIEAKVRRYSPASLRARNFGRSVWSLRPLAFCPESMEVLLSHCRCGAELTWPAVREVHMCDKCGCSLRKGRPGKVDWSLRNDAGHAAALVHYQRDIRNAAISDLPQPFRDWEPGDAFVAVAEFGLVMRDLDNPDPNRKLNADPFAGFSAAHLVAGYRILNGWPGSFQEVVRRCAGGRKGDWRSLLGPLGRFFDGNQGSTPVRALVREAVPALLRSGEIKLGAYRGTRSTWLTNENLISEKQAERDFGLERAIVRRLSGTGDCFVSRRSEAQGASLYDANKLKNSIALLRSAVRPRQCATTLGVPSCCMDALADCGLLSRIQDRDAVILAGEPIYSGSSWNAFLGRLSAVESNGDCGEIVSVSQLLRGRINPRDWAKTIEAIIDQRLRVEVRGAHDTVLDGIFVHKAKGDEFLAQLPKTSLPEDAVVSCKGAEKLVGVSDVYLGKAVAAGILPAQKSYRGLLVRLGDLHSFRVKFAFGMEVSRRTGMSTRNVSRMMECADLQPVALIGQGALWLREHVAKIFPEFAIAQIGP